MKVLFFGQLTKLSKLRGKPTPSTTIRCIGLSRKLEEMGFSCSVSYRIGSDFATNLQEVRKADIVIFHRLQFPMTTKPDMPIELFLHLASKSAKKITIFDLDDAIFLQYPILTELFTARSDLVTVGSHQLAAFALKWNRHVQILPSPVDTDIFNPTIRKRKEGGSCVIGWHGSAYMQADSLRLLIPVLERLAGRYDITFKLLGTMGDQRIQDMFRAVEGLKVDFVTDSWIPYERLPSFLADVDIGVSPLGDSLWSRSKCAMKAIEYMSMGIPMVASAVGEHNYAIRDGVNGLLAMSEDEWVRKISRLIEDRGLRNELGSRARETVTAKYSLGSVAGIFSGAISDFAERRGAR